MTCRTILSMLSAACTAAWLALTNVQRDSTGIQDTAWHGLSTAILCAGLIDAFIYIRYE